MELDIIKENIAVHLGKDPKTYKGQITKIYNSIEEQKLSEGLGDLKLPEEQFQRIILLGVLKNYEIPSDKLDDFILEVPKKEIKPIQEEIKEELDRVGADIIKEIKEQKEVSGASWKDFIKSLPKNENGIKKIPNLRIVDNVKFRLRINTDIEPYHHEGVGRGGKPFESWKFVVKLINIDDEDLAQEVHESGDFKGELLYKSGDEYNLWLTYKKDSFSPMNSFVEFWTEKLGLADFDDRIFVLKRFKKRSKAGRDYSVYKFYEDK